MRRQLLHYLPQFSIETNNLIVGHMLAHLTRSLKDIPKLVTQSRLGNHICDWSGYCRRPRRRQLFDARVKLVVKDVVGQLSITVMFINHAGQRHLVGEDDIRHSHKSPSSPSHFLKWSIDALVTYL